MELYNWLRSMYEGLRQSKKYLPRNRHVRLLNIPLKVVANDYATPTYHHT
jgi:hypothetical protein